MKLQLLPTTFDERLRASPAQHLCCLLIDDCITIDAGSLAMATNLEQKRNIKDIIVTHAHLDHIAGLPLFIDDLFAELQYPIRVHATAEVIAILETHIFNWHIYPRFLELQNDFGAVMKYRPFIIDEEFQIKHLRMRAIEVNHKVPTIGLVVRDHKTTFAFTSDTAQTDKFWRVVNEIEQLDMIFVECAFPNELTDLAKVSYHLTPQMLATEIAKLRHKNCRIFVINIKPMYREKVVAEIESLNIKNLEIMKTGKVYDF